MRSQKALKHNAKVKLSPQRANPQGGSHQFYERQAPQTMLCDGL